MTCKRLRQVVVFAAVLSLLLAVVILAASCGGGSSTTTTTSKTGDPFIDSAVQQIDQQINSVNANDFDESQMSNSALGL